MAISMLTKEAVPGNGTTKQCIPPGLTKAAVLGGRMVCRTASTAAAKTILVQKGTGSSAVTVATFTTPASAGVGTIVTATRATSANVTTFSAASAVNLVASASLASKTFDIHLLFDDNAVMKA